MSHRGGSPRLQINARLVKEKDRARARELRRLLVCGAAIVVPLLVYVWQRVEFLRTSYEVEALKKERQELQERNKQLAVERSFLTSPDRIESLARKELGMIDPAPSDVRRVAVIDGHINEVGERASAGDVGEGSAKGSGAAPRVNDGADRGGAGAPGKKAPRPGRRPTPPRPADASDEAAVEAGVGIVPVAGPATQRRESAGTP